MFFTSGRPTRSIRTLNSPRVSVSATTPTSVRAGQERRCRSRRRCSARSCRRGRSTPGSVKASFRVAIVARAARASMMNGSQRTPAKTRIAVPRAALLVVDAEGDRSPRAGSRRCPAARGPVARPARTCSGRRRRSRGRARRRPGRTATGRRRRSAVSGRSRKRYSSPSENEVGRLGASAGCSSTSTRRPGRSGLGNA